MVLESKNELIGHYETQDIDEVADIIISKASNSFLDKCLEKRLLTIEAKPLINALATAQRLGYETGDVIQEDHHERVIPQEAFPGAGASVVVNGFAQARPQPPQPQPQHAPQQQQVSYPPAHQQLQCMGCYRTFSHPSAYEYHTRASVCSEPPPTSKGFDHSCPHCGQGFTRWDDLQAHQDNRVCGKFTPKVPRGPGRPPRAAPLSQTNPVAILPSMSAQSPGLNGQQISYPPAQSTPSQPAAVATRHHISTPSSTAASPNPADPYGHLDALQLAAMNEELQAAEAKYAPRFAEAERIQDENERRARIEGLRNSFGTKQSMIRKKYGVRLRERRTKAEIQAERERLGIKRAEREKARVALASQQQQQQHQQQHNSPTPATGAVRPAGTPAPATSGWVAANTPQATPTTVWEEHNAKRRRLDGTGSYQTPYKSVGDETPTRKTLSVSEMGGGLAGSPATAATRDPTAPAAQPALASPKVEVPAPESGKQDATFSTQNGDSGRVSMENGPQATTEKEAVVIDDHDDDDSDSSDAESIPSTLPPHVRQSLGSTSGGMLP
ncbi:hypothetical protein B0T22DRAFT_151020 [Podospora appendiculata]|uniref:C2H2-type domain-containing protein n=1 Tax=Podospora appendiculata TaxID=314037 RepID=A0AAE1CCC5_9PEZI|nr:hypothetical protein B0T22DRAFT_151020 [Podospora appendiculata]